ncbi:hypothetical protein [Bowmanella pacifica]|uniref:Uncharacterized protein n=1 Tax=Bowmanella pacifica TaxID=502051 RepID=A0A917YWN9_9ALTE|nr:hypothetical protein [Bowmanella pacifica]GGO66487.1 hypothetical protein GCM10010982_10790 [Bowmanella pacifica]
MKRTFIIILEIALLVVVLRSSFVQYWLGDIQESLSNWMTEIAQTAERQELAALRDRVRPNIAAMNDYQKDYVMDMLSSRTKMEHFQLYYCINKDKNPFVYGATLLYLCSEIGRTSFD